MNSDAISIVMPAYNEEAGIRSTLDHLLDVIQTFAIDTIEIIVVDDGSQDATAELAEAYESIHLIQHQQNRGYGAALKTGIRHARHDIIAIVDADDTYPVERIADLYQELLEYETDMVVGARTGENVHIPLIRRPAKAFLRQLANYVSNTTIPDLNSGLRLFRREVALRFFTILPDQFSFTTTITLAMLANGYQVRYVSINYAARKGHSKIRPIRDTLNFISLVLRIALYFNPLRFFIPLSIGLFVLGILWGIMSIWLLGRFADASTIIILMTGLQTFSIGLLAQLINKRISNEYR